MTVPEAYFYLPQATEAKNAFDKVSDKYSFDPTPKEIRKLPLEAINAIARDFATASVAYFANHSENSMLEDIGTKSWHAINRRRVIVAYSDNAQIGAIKLGLPEKFAVEALPDEPNFTIFKASSVGIIIIPPEFIERSITKPIEALATMLCMLSEVRDMETGKVFEDPIMSKSRAYAVEAQFLLEQQKLDPDLKLGPIYERIINRFPEGINSLPESARY